MQLHVDDSLAIGWLVHGIEPPELSASFFVKGTYQIRHGRRARPSDDPQFVAGDIHYDDDHEASLRYASDFAPFKPRADVLLVGACSAPDGEPVSHLPVSLRVGDLAKTLEVYGNRHWGGMLSATVSPPEPFTAIDLRYESSYGGARYKANPFGKGHREKEETATGRQLPLPNIEYPSEGSRSSMRLEDPAGFGPLGGDMPQRMRYAGTYNAKWEATCWPWFPRDFDWGYFNAAPQDQQVDGYLHGDETILLENLHPEHPEYRTQLPCRRARCFIKEQLAEGHRVFREVPLMLDTLWIDMQAEGLILVWRGHVVVEDLKLKELEHVLAVTESLSDPPGTAHEYRDELNRRIGALEPADPAPADPAAEAAFQRPFAEMDREIEVMDREFAEAEQQAERVIAETERQLAESQPGLRAAGVDPAIYLAGMSANVPEGEAIAASMEEIERLEKSLPDASDVRADIVKLRQELTTIQSELAAFDSQMEQAELEFAEIEGEPWSRERVIEAAQRDESFAEANLSGLDLSGLDLAGRDFTAARLDECDLSNTNLAGARLSGAQFRKATLRGTDLSAANADEAIFSEAVLEGAQFAGTSLSHAKLADLKLAGLDFSSCHGSFADFARSDLSRAVFTGCRLDHAAFCEGQLAEARFDRGHVTDSDFEGTAAPGIDMTGSDITGLRGSEAADFSRGQFAAARADGAIFDGSKLDGADFSRSTLRGATFSDGSTARTVFAFAALENARFDDTNLEEANLESANLLRCSFERANLTRAQLQGANLYEAAFWNARTEEADFRDANLKGTMLG